MLTSSDRAIVLPILRSIGANVYLMDVLEDGTFRYFAVNWPERTNAGLPYKGSVIGRRPEEIFDTEIAERAIRHYHKCVQQRTHVQFEGSFEGSAGKRWTNHFLAPIFDLTGRIVRIMGTIIEITPQKKAELALQDGLKRFRTLYEDNPAKLMTVDMNGMILSINTFGAQYIGYSRDEIVNTSLFDYIPVEDKRRAIEFLQIIRAQPEKLHHSEFRTIKKDGALLWTSNSARVTETLSGNKVILIVSDDTTEAHELASDLAYQASHDWLTGLVNRREFESQLRSLIDSAIKEKTRHALCYLDLDQFKIINDTCGHGAGDELLSQVGAVLQDHVRKEDTVARLGGDEFGILAVNRTLDEAEEMGRTLCRVIDDYPFIWEDRKFNIGVSIGIAPVTESSGRVVDLLRAADRACYAAKDKGRSRVHVYREHDPDLKKKHGEMEWVNRINLALAEDRFRLYFQPIVPVNDQDRGIHFEILLRLEDVNGQTIFPSSFLPAAEHYNIIGKLDRWVVNTVFQWLMRRPRQLELLHLCAINLSGTSLADEAFLNVIIGAFNDIPVPPGKVCFEITETAAITNFTSTMRFIRTLKERGCRFSLDDFGAGLSCFKYLTNFPVDYLKIDGQFIRDIIDNPVSRAIVKSITEIGHIMNKKIIAEYVEDETTLEILRQMGVDYYQGFMLSRPQPVQ